MLYVTWYDRKSMVYWIEFHAVRDTAIIDTPYGKYFVAHSRIPGGWCVKYEDVREEIRKTGITWKKMQSWAAITNDQLDTLCRLLHIKPDKLKLT